MISMVHRDGDTTIQMVEIDGEFEVSLHQSGECCQARRYAELQAALAGYCATIAAEVSCYLGHDVPWFADTVRYESGAREIDPS